MKPSEYVIMIGCSVSLLMAFPCGFSYAAHVLNLQFRRPYWDWASVYRLVWRPKVATLEDMPEALAARRSLFQLLTFMAAFACSLALGGMLRYLGH